MRPWNNKKNNNRNYNEIGTEIATETAPLSGEIVDRTTGIIIQKNQKPRTK